MSLLALLIGLALPAAGVLNRTDGSIWSTGPHFLTGFYGFEILLTGTAHTTTVACGDGR